MARIIEVPTNQLILTNSGIIRSKVEKLVSLGATAVSRIKPLPSVSQFHETFYVLDGNHRIAALIQLGHGFVRVNLVEVYSFSPDDSLLAQFRYSGY